MPTPDRLPQPPGPPTLASILADHEREKRRQQRPVSKSGLPVAGEDDGLIQIAVEMDGGYVLPDDGGLWLVSVVASAPLTTASVADPYWYRFSLIVGSDLPGNTMVYADTMLLYPGAYYVAISIATGTLVVPGGRPISAVVTQDGTVPTEAWEPMRTLTATRIGNAAT